MSLAPNRLVELGRYWTEQGGVNLGIVGNAAHTVGYHLGKDRIYDGAGPGLGDDDYSVKHARDKAGLTNAASAIDLGRLDGSLSKLQAFSRWLVEQVQAKAEGTADIREIVYSPDGSQVQRVSGIDFGIHTGAGNGDASHKTHTHISYFRDSQPRDKVELFRRYFEEHTMGLKVDLTGSKIGVATFPSGTRVLRVSDGDTTTFSTATTTRNVYAEGSVSGTAVWIVEWASEAYTIRKSACEFTPVAAADCTPLIEAARQEAAQAATTAERTRAQGIRDQAVTTLGGI